MIEPRATLRLQFHAGFTLDDALPWLDYFADLGISHLYASPLFRARPGSSHGYDVVDPTRINPELGGEPALLRLIQGLRQRGMGLLMDIVPNHMGIGGGANPWWQDVLEWGRESPYASFFDIQWESHDAALRGQVLLPFLRSDYGEVLAAGEIGLSLDREAGRLLASHGEQRFPLWPGSYPELLEDSGEPRLSALAGGFRECRQDREALREMQRQLAAGRERSARSPPAHAGRTPGTPRGGSPTPAPPARGAALPPGQLAHRGGRHQLAPFLRHQRTGRPAGRARRGVRGRARQGLPVARGRSARWPAHRSRRRPGRSARLLPTPAPPQRADPRPSRRRADAAVR